MQTLFTGSGGTPQKQGEAHSPLVSYQLLPVQRIAHEPLQGTVVVVEVVVGGLVVGGGS